MPRYFLTTFIGYCVGLAAANLAVMLMQMGQPVSVSQHVALWRSRVLFWLDGWLVG